MDDHPQRFHAVFCVAAAGPDGITRGALARRFRCRAVRLDRTGLARLLDRLVGEGVLDREPAGRSERFRSGAGARDFLAAAGMLVTAEMSGIGSVRYSAPDVAAVLAFAAGHTSAGESLVDAVRALAADTATGLVTLAALRGRTGHDREALHAAVCTALEEGDLLIHPIAARHQATPEEMADGIRTPSGQVLYYVELA